VRWKSLSWAAFESGSRLSRPEEAERFSGGRSRALIIFEAGRQFSHLAKEAFYWSGLTSIHLPASVTVIGESCFSGGGSLVSIF
jgi:hypothetical protein